MQHQQPRLKVNAYHGPKRQLLGAQGTPPAWKTPGAAKAANATGRRTASGPASISTLLPEAGSKILISRLPADVTEQEVRDLFNKTVGPTTDVFLIYNNNGQPKGMAVVIFQKVTDAELARTKYDGKIVDGKRPIKIELIVREQSVSQPSNPPPPLALSLLDRIQMRPSAATKQQEKPAKVAPLLAQAVEGKPKPQPTKRRSRTRKGPARLKRKTSVQDLDREMEEYRAAGPPANNNFVFFPPKQDHMLT